MDMDVVIIIILFIEFGQFLIKPIIVILKVLTQMTQQADEMNVGVRERVCILLNANNSDCTDFGSNRIESERIDKFHFRIHFQQTQNDTKMDGVHCLQAIFQ